ncbi:T9SS type A sorting domain-containing protein [Pedobacter sp. P351]|uniref:T9SS type A sorting domain-containing protein n=1 Tax=Pedobacter superstes TaxID=3133441 RepID=UPI0030A0F0F9
MAILLSSNIKSNAQSWASLGLENDVSLGTKHSSWSSVTTIETPSGTVPYVVFAENGSTGSTITAAGPVRVRRYVNNAWEDVGTSGLSALGFHTNIFSDNNGKVYVIYADMTASGKMAVKTYDVINNTWIALGGLEHISTGSVVWSGHANFDRPNPYWMAFDKNNNPYVVHTEQSETNKPYVKRFINNSWETLGGTSVSAERAAGLSLAIDQTTDNVYVGYVNILGTGTTNSNGSLTLGIYNGSAWTTKAPSTVLTARHSTMELDGNNNPVFAFTNTGGSNRANIIRYDRTAETWGTPFTLSTTTQGVGTMKMARSQRGDIYIGFMDNITPKVFKLMSGATTWEQLWDGATAIDTNGDRVGLAVGKNNKVYFSYVRANASNFGTVRVKEFTGPVTLSYTGNTAFCPGALLLTSSAASNNQWFLNSVAIDGATGTTYTPIASGSYAVKVVTDPAATPLTYSISSNSVTVTANPAPTASVTANGALSPGVVLSAPAGYTYQWSKDGADISGAISADYTTTSSGSYRVNVTLNGCSTLSDAQVVLSAPTITAGGASTFCLGGSVVLTSSISGNNQWKKDGVDISGAINDTYTATGSGVFTVATSGVNSSNSITVIVNPYPTATVTANGTLVTGVTLSAPATSGYTYQWSKDGADISGAISGDYTTTSAGTYRVNVTSNSCSVLSDAQVVSSSIPAPTISAGGPTTFCQGGSVVLTSSNLSGNQWKKDGVDINAAINNTYTTTESGTYTVSTSGVNSSNSVPVTVNPAPTAAVTASGSLVLASGGSVVLTANAGTGYTFQWTKDGVDINTATSANYTATATGSYRVKVALGSCTTISDASVITVTPTISHSGSTTFCQGGNLVLTSSATSGNQWNKDGVAISNATGPTYTVTSSGSYTVSNGSTTSTSVNVVVNPTPTATVTAGGPLNFIIGGNVVLTANPGTGYTFQWTKDGADINTATNANYTVTTAGSYRVKVTLGSCTTVSNATVVTVTIPVPTISYTGSTTLCQGENLILTSSAASANQWYKDGVAISGANTSTYTVNSLGTYTVTALGSIPSNGVTVTVNPLPLANITAAGPLDLRTGGSVVLVASTGDNYTYKWFRNGTLITNATTNNYTATQGGNYTVETTKNSCVVMSSAVTVGMNFYLPQTNFRVAVNGESCKTSNNGKIKVTTVQDLNYTAQLIKDGAVVDYSFDNDLEILNLSAGTYSLCISVVGESSYSQCFDNLVIVEPQDLAVFASVNQSDKTITLDLKGGKNYNVRINGVSSKTTQSSITLALSQGDNKISVSADNECQGVFEKLVTLDDKILIYPNPFDDFLKLTLSSRNTSKISVSVKSLEGKLAYAKQFDSASNINLDLSHLTSGIYLLKLSLDNSDSYYKVIKR